MSGSFMSIEFHSAGDLLRNKAKILREEGQEQRDIAVQYAEKAREAKKLASDIEAKAAEFEAAADLLDAAKSGAA